MVRKEIDGQVLAGDAFVSSLKMNLRAEWVPDIYEHQVASFDLAMTHKAMIDRLRRRDETMWQFYEAYIKTAVADASDDDILLEGNLWPDFLELFSLPHKAVFLVDTSSNQAERLIAIRDSKSDNNWMERHTNERIAEWALFNVARSERYIALSEQSNYVFFDIAEGGIETAQREAFEYLLPKAV